MPNYRLCKLDEASKFSSSVPFHASDDAEAMQSARAAGYSFECQVWHARRLVGRVLAT